MEIAIELVRDPLTVEDSIDGTYAYVLLLKNPGQPKTLWKSLYTKNPGQPKTLWKSRLKKILESKNTFWKLRYQPNTKDI